MNYKNVLKNLMIQKDWNQEDLAKAGEVKQPTVSRYLSGHTIPTLTFITNLYRNANIDPIIFVRDYELEPINLERVYSRDEKEKLAVELNKFLRFLKSSPEVLEIFWKLYKMDRTGMKSMNFLADKILEE
ncbi:DNA-binding helix-turn-helix protein [Leptospira santarosai str. CBC379]|uniref:DNA-binding helix-turn-helix protein n=1 Tax=Leptospira santarosai str. MOR084 TaxID=1049984 RepID=A0A0E2BAC8_9LEPT|nr:helix-turn-helix domain-containing protein [Leptospira santarosai]EKO32288.1 DNA-binding helix-turn-helix protein [Leptospira santarosai str. MOR084]EKR92072.1 DNA-binding helix-turn-helix protein [Leptospira santarosai str. CBC379]MDI7225854.1 helix-turn-helix domain-containing protein [Leptospira santarosai]